MTFLVFIIKHTGISVMSADCIVGFFISVKIKCFASTLLSGFITIYL